MTTIEAPPSVEGGESKNLYETCPAGGSLEFKGDYKNLSLDVGDGGSVRFFGSVKNAKIEIGAEAIVTIEGDAKNLRVKALKKPGLLSGVLDVRGQKVNVREEVESVGGDVSAEEDEKGLEEEEIALPASEIETGKAFWDEMVREAPHGVGEPLILEDEIFVWREEGADEALEVMKKENVVAAVREVAPNTRSGEILINVAAQLTEEEEPTLEDFDRLAPGRKTPSSVEILDLPTTGENEDPVLEMPSSTGEQISDGELFTADELEILGKDSEIMDRLVELKAGEQRVKERGDELEELRKGEGVGEEDVEKAKMREGGGFLRGWRGVRDAVLSKLTGFASSAVALGKSFINKAEVVKRMEAVRGFLGRRHERAQANKMELKQDFDNLADAPPSAEDGKEPIDGARKVAMAGVFEEVDVVKGMKEAVDKEINSIMRRFKEKVEGSKLADIKEAQSIFDEEIKDLLGPKGRAQIDLTFSSKESLSAEELQSEINFMLAVNMQGAMRGAIERVSDKKQNEITRKMDNVLQGLIYDKNSGGLRQFGKKTPQETKSFFVKILEREYGDMEASDPKARALSEFLTKLKNKKVG